MDGTPCRISASVSDGEMNFYINWYENGECWSSNYEGGTEYTSGGIEGYLILNIDLQEEYPSVTATFDDVIMVLELTSFDFSQVEADYVMVEFWPGKYSAVIKYCP